MKRVIGSSPTLSKELRDVELHKGVELKKCNCPPWPSGILSRYFVKFEVTNKSEYPFFVRGTGTHHDYKNSPYQLVTVGAQCTVQFVTEIAKWTEGFVSIEFGRKSDEMETLELKLDDDIPAE